MTPPSEECMRGALRASNENRMFIGANTMRPFLILGLLITLCAPANAVTDNHSGHHVVVHPSPGWAYTAPRPRIDYDDTPSYDDPSKFGGGRGIAGDALGLRVAPTRRHRDLQRPR
jgi:hypothetical protein